MKFSLYKGAVTAVAAEASNILHNLVNLDKAVDHYANKLGFTLKVYQERGLSWFYAQDERGIGVLMARPEGRPQRVAGATAQAISREPLILWGEELD